MQAKQLLVFLLSFSNKNCGDWVLIKHQFLMQIAFGFSVLLIKLTEIFDIYITFSKNFYFITVHFFYL